MVAAVLERYWQPNQLGYSFNTEAFAIEAMAANFTITSAMSTYLAKVNRAMYLIPRCRTGRLGGLPMQCEQCGDLAMKLHSCQGRHCPTCNAQNRRLWRDRLVGWSLDCNYLHVVFTLPHELNELIYTNQKPMHKLLFRCVNNVLTRIASHDYGCKIGTVQVLHTWGQRLGLHYHIHVVMTAGGVSFDESKWIPISADDAAMQQSNIAAMFRQTYLRRVTSMLKRGVVQCEAADAMLSKIAKKDWVINVQPPPPHCQGAEAVIHYLSSYVIGGPISDRRIVADDGTFVTIRFKNYTTEQIEFEKILGTEFADRFSHHVLPPYMQRVRYTSLFQPSGRVPRLVTVHEQAQPHIHSEGYGVDFNRLRKSVAEVRCGNSGRLTRGGCPRVICSVSYKLPAPSKFVQATAGQIRFCCPGLPCGQSPRIE